MGPWSCVACVAHVEGVSVLAECRHWDVLFQDWKFLLGFDEMRCSYL
jgi:hypothetical protein